jgi:transposase InsO family protein
MELRWSWRRFTVAALLDGCTRKLLQLKIYPGRPTSSDMIGLVSRAIRSCGLPRFLITDHGSQFRRRFRHAMTNRDITQVRGRVRSPTFNGKIERFFKTLRLWQRFTLLPLTVSGIQRRINNFTLWYNTTRPHQAIGGLTPEEAWLGQEPSSPIPIRAGDQLEPAIEIRRKHYRGDPRLPLLSIRVCLQVAA